MKKGYEDCTRYNHRTEEEKKNLLKRLNIINGQINGIKQMIENDRFCDEVLIQISAVDKSLKSIGKEIIKGHMQTCVMEDMKNDKLEVVDDVIDLFEKLN